MRVDDFTSFRSEVMLSTRRLRPPARGPRPVTALLRSTPADCGRAPLSLAGADSLAAAGGRRGAGRADARASELVTTIVRRSIPASVRSTKVNGAAPRKLIPLLLSGPAAPYLVTHCTPIAAPGLKTPNHRLPPMRQPVAPPAQAIGGTGRYLTGIVRLRRKPAMMRRSLPPSPGRSRVGYCLGTGHSICKARCF